MPWKLKSLKEAKARFILKCKAGLNSFTALCRQSGISRKTGYKWRRRYRTRGFDGLADRSRRPHRLAKQSAGKWRRRLQQLRRWYPRWGPKKLRCLLVEHYGPKGVPARSTLGRWLRAWGWTQPRARRARRGPVLERPGLSPARRSNAVWTVDFKGWFRTGDGLRCEPLTVVDLFSRFILGLALLADQSYAPTRAVFVWLFRRYGLPRCIRVDNGGPFGSTGALGLSRLSAWWMRLGIRVEFIRPAHPEENAAHERMHREYKAETARPPAPTRRGQQVRTTRFQRRYNCQRPHAALGQRRPAALYRASARSDPTVLPQWRYPGRDAVRRVRSNGQIKWQGRTRFIGEAFVGERIGLKASGPGKHAEYFLGALIGTLHGDDKGGMRPASCQRHYGPLPKPKV